MLNFVKRHFDKGYSPSGYPEVSCSVIRIVLRLMVALCLRLICELLRTDL